MTTISAIIITHNEEDNIGRCLTSLQGIADEIVVVDSGSTDATEKICHEHGVRFVSHKWEGYAGQKNYANSLATKEWTLSIDADEELSPTLRSTLLMLKKEAETDTIYAFNRLNNCCGRWIRHCGWYPDIKIRLWPTGTAEWRGDVHEELTFSKEMKKRTLDGDLLHYTYNTLHDFADRQSRYAELSASEAYRRGKRCPWTAPVVRPLWTFVRNYLFRGGFLDGAAGYTVCRMSAYYTFMKYTNLRQLMLKEEIKNQ